jgi:hypothetical protein
VTDLLRQAGHHNVRGFGSSYKLLDSYNWSLAKVLAQNSRPIYDYVFIDGAHTFAVDALATLLLDRLLKVGGYMDLDDWDWTLRGSPSLNPRVFPATNQMYTPEQIETRQVELIIDVILRRSPCYREVVPNKVVQTIA